MFLMAGFRRMRGRGRGSRESCSRAWSRWLEYASRRGIPFAVFAGESELERGEAAIKDLDSGRQWTAPIDSIAVEVHAALAGKFN